MGLSHFHYTKLVTAEYHKKLANREIPGFASGSSPAKLKEICITLCEKGTLKKDEHVLMGFFRRPLEERPLLTLIRRTEIAKFKPLDNYLRKHTVKTEDKNIDLLAWIIDFKHRPFSVGMNVELSDEDLEIIDEAQKPPLTKQTSWGTEDENLGKIANDQLQNTQYPPTFSSRFGRTIQPKDWIKKLVVILLLIISGIGMFALWQKKVNSRTVMGSTVSGCMYWNIDHYESIACDKKYEGRLILPLDEEKKNRFFMITDIDTITEKSIGVIHCISINGKREYYTTAGYHPIYVTKTLKPLSSYIFNKYLAKKVPSEN